MSLAVSSRGTLSALYSSCHPPAWSLLGMQYDRGRLLCFSQKLDLGASASVAKSLFHWLRGRFMMLKRMLRIQFL